MSLRALGLVLFAAAALIVPRVAKADEVVATPPARGPVAAPGPTIIYIPAPAPAKRKAKPKANTKHAIIPPAVVVGGTIVGAGTVTMFVGLAGYLSSIRCHTHEGTGYIRVPSLDCRSKPSWFAVSGVGLAVATAGVPVLAVGLSGKRVPIDTPPPTSAELLVGPLNAGLRVQF